MKERHLLYAETIVVEINRWKYRKQKWILILLWIIKKISTLNIESSTLFLLDMNEKKCIKEKVILF